jgi:hypothetical protein
MVTTRIKNYLSTNLDLIANVLLGIGAFVAVCGWRALDFTNTKLVMASGVKTLTHLAPGEYLHIAMLGSGDKTQSYLAGMIYRSEPFSWDIFRTYSINPPEGISGTATDINPLWSLLFKFLGAFGFDPYWQTEGLLALSSFVLIGVASTYIFRHIFRERKDRWLVSVASLFFIFSPVMLDRVFEHVNLVMHWIFLFAFVLYLNDRLARKEWILGAILLVLSMGMHPYFFPMTAVPLGALALKQLSGKSISPRIFMHGVILWSAVLVVMALLLFPLGDMKSVQREGYGLYSMNLNTLFNPIWTKSRFIPTTLGHGEGQYEGDNYLGFGLLILFVMLIPAIRAFCKNRSATGHHWLIAGCGILLFFAISFKIQLYNFTIFEYYPGITRRIGETFRSSGRLFWPCWYFLSYFLIWLLFQTRKNNAKYILVALVALQLYDLSPTIFMIHRNIKQWSKIQYQSTFQAEAWNTLFEKYSNVFIVGNIHENKKIYEDLWYMIPSRKIQVNDGYFAMITKSMRKAKDEENLLKRGAVPTGLPENTIFIFISKSVAESYLKHAPSLSSHVKELDGVHYLLWNKSLVERNKIGDLMLKWNACDLPVTSANVQVDEKFCKVTSLANSSGNVTYGPYIRLTQGNYSFEIEYTGVSSALADVGDWDVVTNTGLTVLEKGVLPGTDGNHGTFCGTFALPPEYTKDSVEIRTFVRPDAQLTIHGIEIEQID